jgi:hypothetical protein
MEKQLTVVWFRTKNCQEMALKSIKRLILSIDGASIKFVLAVCSAILIMKNVFFSKTFDAELMFRTAAIHLTCYENNFSEIDF